MKARDMNQSAFSVHSDQKQHFRGRTSRSVMTVAALLTAASAMAQGGAPQPEPYDINKPRPVQPAPAQPSPAQPSPVQPSPAQPATPAAATPPVTTPGEKTAAETVEGQQAEVKAVTPAAEGDAKAEPVPAGPTAQDVAAQREAAKAKGSIASPGNPGECDGLPYPVTRFLIEYNIPNDQQPAADSLLDVMVTLGSTPKGFVSPYELYDNGDVITDIRGVAVPRSGTNLVTMKLRDLPGGTGATFYATALRAIYEAVAAHLQEDFRSVFVLAAEDQIAFRDMGEDIYQGDDLRDGINNDLRLVVWMAEVGEIRTNSSGFRLEKKIEQEKISRINADDRVHQRIREQSPVQKGDLIRKDLVDDYIFRLNRHPGRRVDVALAPGEQPQEATLDYLVSENKPWTAYFQLSNTGTEATSEWRQRFGFVHNQLSDHDDILRVDYITGNFDASHSVNLSYEFPLLSDKLKLRTYGGYSEYTASDVGFADETFDGENLNIGTELVGNIWQRRSLFVDGIAGIKWQSVDVNNTLLQQQGEDNFFTPYLGFILEQYTDDSATFASLTTSWNMDELDAENKDRLGRPSVDSYFTVVRFTAEHTAFLEPLFNKWGWFQGDDGKGMQNLTHEVSASVRGQWSLDNRLIPNEEDVAGGLFSVRGYPESIVAGDDVVIASLEYRFHLPTAFGTSEPGRWGDKRMTEVFGSDFRWRPQQEFGRADWDLIFKTFIDFGNTNSVDKEPGEESDTLVGTGVGVELVFKRNLSMRLDWGVALTDAGPTDLSTNEPEVESGSNRFHFLMTLSY